MFPLHPLKRDDPPVGLKIPLDDSKDGLADGQQSILRIPNIRLHKGQASGLVSYPGLTKKMVSFGLRKVLDVTIDGSAIIAHFQIGVHGPAHSGIHKGEKDAAVGLAWQRPAHLRPGGQDGMSSPLGSLFDTNTDRLV